MSAKPKRDEQQEEHPIITRFRERYTELLVDAERSRDLTATDGWQTLYANTLKARREALAQIAERMTELAEMVKKSVPSEDNERAVADVRKSLIEVREEWEHFDRSTIAPVRYPASDAQKLISDSLYAAQEAQANAPLVERGLVDSLRDAMKDVPAIVWNEETGTLTLERRT